MFHAVLARAEQQRRAVKSLNTLLAIAGHPSRLIVR
jgi:hypothetical protein